VTVASHLEKKKNQVRDYVNRAKQFKEFYNYPEIVIIDDDMNNARYSNTESIPIMTVY
jgi:hypothetical protein